jgi:hypothetical protein
MSMLLCRLTSLREATGIDLPESDGQAEGLDDPQAGKRGKKIAGGHADENCRRVSHDLSAKAVQQLRLEDDAIPEILVKRILLARSAGAENPARSEGLIRCDSPPRKTLDGSEGFWGRRGTLD